MTHDILGQIPQLIVVPPLSVTPLSLLELTEYSAVVLSLSNGISLQKQCRAFLSVMDELAIIFPGSENMGHQGSTVCVLAVTQ